MRIPLGIDAVLLFVLSIPVVMKYRILPISGTPYWLFGILFFLLLANIIISTNPERLLRFLPIGKIKSVILWAVLAIVVGGTTMTAIVDRHATAPVWGVHDIILQQEAAMRYLILGKNPYKETYFGTPVESFRYDEMGKPAVNPALYHFVMPPWYLLFPFPFYFLANQIFGYFDGRMMLLFTLAGLLIILTRFFKHPRIAALSVILTALSPGVIDYFIEGRSDTFALFWLVLSLYLFEKKKLFWSSVFFGLGMVSKQTIWFALPFYLCAVGRKTAGSYKKIVQHTFIVLGVSAVVTLPFLLWDPRAFIDSVILYLAGGTRGGYPISGYGIGMLLYEFGIIKDLHAYYPFILWQAAFGLPVLAISIWWFTKQPRVSRLLFAYALTLAVVWYFSRYLNNSHLGYVSSLLVLAILKDWDEKTIAPK